MHDVWPDFQQDATRAASSIVMNKIGMAQLAASPMNTLKNLLATSLSTAVAHPFGACFNGTMAIVWATRMQKVGIVKGPTLVSLGSTDAGRCGMGAILPL